MFHSEQFERRLLRADSRAEHDGESSRPDRRTVQDAFAAAAPPLPEGFSRELIGDSVANEGADADTIQFLGDVVDLLHEQYDENADRLTAEQWRLVRDLVDSYAVEMDMSLVQYVMELVLARGLL